MNAPHTPDAPAGRPLNPAPHQPSTGLLASLRTDLPTALCALLLFFLPLYRSRVLEDSFNTPKLALAIVMAVIIAIAVLVRPAAARVSLRRYPAPWLLIGFVLWNAVSVLWAGSKPLAVDHTIYLATFAVLGWIFVRTPPTIAAINSLFSAGAAAAVITAAWVLYEDFTGGSKVIVARLPDWRGYLSAGLGNSGHIAGMVGMFFPFLILKFLAPASAGRIAGTVIHLIAIVLCAAAFIVTWSVGSSGATIISLLLWTLIAWRALPARTIRMRRLLLLAAAGALPLLLYFTPNPLNPHYPSIYTEAFSSQRWEDGWPTRLAIWKTTWHMITQAPLLGFGTGTLTYFYPQQIVPSVIADPQLHLYAGSFTNDAHNDYLQIWAETGAVGLALWIAVLVSFFSTTLRNLRPRHHHPDLQRQLLYLSAGAGLTVFALDGLMSFPMHLPAHLATAVFFLSVPGMMLFATPTVPLAPASRRWRIGGVGILLTLAACMWHAGHRVLAEYYLKSARTTAENPALNISYTAAPPWHICQSYYDQLIDAVATGAPPEQIQAIASAMQQQATVPAMARARRLLEKSVSIDRYYGNANSRLGQLLLYQNQWHESVEVSRNTLKTLQASEVHERYGLAAYLAGDLLRARQQWTLCRDRVPRLADAYTQLIDRTLPQP